MTPKERVLATFEHEPTDKVPIHHVGFSGKIASAILGREVFVGFGIQRWREANALWQGEEAHRTFIEKSIKDAFEVARATEQDILRLQYWRLPEKPTKKIDKFTFLYGDPKVSWRIMKFHPFSELYGVVEEYPKRKITLKDIKNIVLKMEEQLDYAPPFPDVSEERDLIKAFGDEYVVRVHGGFIQVPLNSIWLAAIVSKPDLVARYLDVQLELTLRRIRALSKAGAKLIFGGGDMAGNDGPFYSPKAFRELMVPRLRRIAEECHKYGMYYLFASDGNLWPIADDLFGRTGIDGYYEIDRRAGMDLEKLKKRFPDLVLVGNISSYTLTEGSKYDVVKETLSCLKVAKRYGGIIVGVSNAILPTTPIENVMAMIETIKKYR